MHNRVAAIRHRLRAGPAVVVKLEGTLCGYELIEVILLLRNRETSRSSLDVIEVSLRSVNAGPR